MFDFTKLKKKFNQQGPIYMVSGTRANPPPSYPKRANFSLISLQNSADRLHEVANSSWEGETTRREGGRGGCGNARAR